MATNITGKIWHWALGRFQVTKLARISLVALATSLATSQTMACSIMPDKLNLITYTHHLNAENPDIFDEGLNPRGLALGWDCAPWQPYFAVYDHSMQGFGLGYTLSLTHDAFTYENGPLSIGPVAGISWYPDEPTALLRETNGLFPMIGLSVDYEIFEDVSLIVNYYPSGLYPSKLKDDAFSFEGLIVGMISWDFGGS